MGRKFGICYTTHIIKADDRHICSRAMPKENSIIQSEAEKKLYLDLLEYLKSVETNGNAVVGFTLSDGTHCFSISNLVDILLEIRKESALSERLWIIVSVAYLEDQLRALLEKFLVDHEVSSALLDPNSGPISSLVPMANVAFSLGLITREWLDVLKRMAQLRNKFAHIPSARSFTDLMSIDPKAAGLLDSLKSRYIQLTSDGNQTVFQKLYVSLFISMYSLLQFSIDHVATLQQHKPLDSHLIVSIHDFVGVTVETIEELIQEAT